MAQCCVVTLVTNDLADAILAHVTSYAVGLVERVEGAGSRVLGSGVLVSIDGRCGILTCGHVAAVYDKLPGIGVIRFAAGDQQRQILDLGETQTIIMESGATWSETGLDLAFTQLTPDIASSIGAKSLFLNIERNRTKMEAGPPAHTGHFDAMLGLVAEFSGTPVVEAGRFVSPMRGVLHSGHIVSQENGLLVVNALEYNIDKMPESFGGMSGGGLWRAYFVDGQDGPRLVETVLCGVASYQIDSRKIACQGWDRIDQALIPTVRENLKL
jgi:hypothetical protein